MMQVPPVPRRNRRNQSRSNANNSNETQQKQQESEQPKAYHFNQCRNIIKSAIKCPICFESMLDPSADSRVLPCQHAFCRSCLAKLLDSCTSSAGDSTRIGGPVCPECRAPISAIRADDLPPNVQLNRLCNELDELQQKHHSSLDSSASKSSGDSANSNCRRRQQRQSCNLTVLSGDFCTATREFNYRSTDSRRSKMAQPRLIDAITKELKQQITQHLAVHLDQLVDPAVTVDNMLVDDNGKKLYYYANRFRLYVQRRSDQGHGQYLELRRGDLIEIISRRCSTALDAPSDAGASTASAPGWAYGRIGQRKGYFPLACTRPVVGNQRKLSANQSSKKCDAYPVVCALYDYQPSDAISLDCANQSTAVSLLP
uniref:RING-type domain-containing protein n=1 Tax=Macrostomum lignano TaxID=282301 RepID=A0A1I8HX62_9PLAT